MIVYHNFLVDVSRYAELGKANDFPELDCCPMCQAKNWLKRHGFYERNAIDAKAATYRIIICRLICPDCGRTVSILPTFLLPYFQHTIDFIICILLAYWTTRQSLCTRPLRWFYAKRVYGKLTEIMLFFREEGNHQVLPEEPNEKAIKLLQMIQALGKAAFVRRWWRHRISSFMAHSLYHGTRVAKTE
ncbi:Uncharacterised protein [Mycobacterium tuberculosis]|nr:Uncharacterised protein [Mycobacterium tuberculosis]